MNVVVTSSMRDEFDIDALESLGVYVLESENAPLGSEVSITLVENQQIADLNREHRNIDSPTDVLSFECDGIDDAPLVTDDGEEFLMLGDVVIAPDIAREQAREYGVSFDEELDLLVIHGILHLLGYDHIEDEDATIMESRESELLYSWRHSR